MKKLIGILSISAGILINAQTYDIKLNLEKGKTYTLKNVNNSLVNQQVMGQNMDMKNTLQTNISCKVISKTENVYNLEVKYDLIEMSINVQGRDVKMSSEDTTNSDESKAFVAIKNEAFNVMIDDKANVLEIKGYDKVVNKMMASIPESQKAGVMESLKSFSSDESVKSQMSSLFLPIPSGKLKIGDQWKKSSKIITSMKLDSENTYTLVSADANQYKITYTGTQKSNPSEKLKLSGYDATADLSGTSAGTISLDAKSAWFLLNEASSDIKGKMTLEIQGNQIPVDLTIKSSSKTTN